MCASARRSSGRACCLSRIGRARLCRTRSEERASLPDLRQNRRHIFPREGDAAIRRRIAGTSEMGEDRAAPSPHPCPVIVAEHQHEIVERVATHHGLRHSAHREAGQAGCSSGRLGRRTSRREEGADGAQQGAVRGRASRSARYRTPRTGKGADGRRSVALAWTLSPPRPSAARRTSCASWTRASFGRPGARRTTIGSGLFALTRASIRVFPTELISLWLRPAPRKTHY